MGPEVLLLYLQEHTTEPYPKPTESCKNRFKLSWT